MICPGFFIINAVFVQMHFWLSTHMASMLDYIDKLGELDTTGVEPMSHVFPVHNVFREDVVTNGDDRENIIKNAPEEKDGMFVVPSTF